jgi:hypothetical protein
MQIKTGTASVTNGSNRVIFASADLSAITFQALFGLDQILGAPIYSIVDIQKPALAAGPWDVSVSGLWEIFLAVPYAQVTNPAAAFLVQKDFLTLTVDSQNFYICQFESGDTQTLPLLSRNNVTWANWAAAMATRPIYLWNADQLKWFALTAKGAAGEEIIHLSETGIP